MIKRAEWLRCILQKISTELLITVLDCKLDVCKINKMLIIRNLSKQPL